MHEVVTLQFGQRANYLATHFWNVQESYFTYAPNTEPSIVDHDILFRPGIGADGGDTYTPRTVIYDLKGGFGSLKKINALYDDRSTTTYNSSINARRTNGLTTIKQPPITQIQYQRDLDAGLPTRQLTTKDVRYWSDFNRVFFHPRSIAQLNEYELNSTLMPFEHWSAGEDLWRSVDREEGGILDRDVRLFVEECDQMQGFQVFSGTDDAWGGWCAEFVAALRDEFGKKSVWVLGVEDGGVGRREEMVGRKANAARSLAELAGVGRSESGVDGYVRCSTRPGSMPGYVELGESEWESAALIAAAMESVMLPMRLRGGGISGGGRGSSMGRFETVLNTNEGQNVFELGLKVVFGENGQRNGQTLDVRQRQNVEDEEERDEGTTFDICFTPSSISLLPNIIAGLDNHDHRRHTFAQIETSRRPKRTTNNLPLSQSLDREELLRRRYNEEAIVERFNIPLGYPQLDSSPAHLFRSPDDHHVVREWSLSAGLTTSSAMKQSIFELRDVVTRYNRAVALDDREELYNGLTEIGDKYSFGWDSADDSEDE